jgi:hypothetical protein
METARLDLMVVAPFSTTSEAKLQLGRPMFWNPEGEGRRKIRLIECNAKKIDPVKGLSRQAFLLSEAPSPAMTSFYPPPHTLYSHREGGRLGELTREKVRGAMIYKTGRKYQHD